MEHRKVINLKKIQSRFEITFKENAKTIKRLFTELSRMS